MKSSTKDHGVHRRQFALGVAVLLTSRNAGADTDIGALVARVGRARSPIRTLQGPFQQTRTIGLLATEVRSKGTFLLVRPEALRWELAPPDEVTFWISPEGLAYKTAHGGGRLPSAAAHIGGLLEDLRTVLGGDLGRLHERWELRVVRDDASGAEVEASPRPGVAARLQTLRFVLAPDLAQPTRVLLIEGPRDRTLIEFGLLTVNAHVDEALVKPPA